MAASIDEQVSADGLMCVLEESGGLSPQRPPLPMITGRKIAFPPPNKAPQQAWLESLATVDNEKLGLVDLHPDVFATFPRYEFDYRKQVYTQGLCNE